MTISAPYYGQVLSFLEERLFFLKVYQGALLPGIPPIKLPKFIFKVYYSDLQPLDTHHSGICEGRDRECGDGNVT